MAADEADTARRQYEDTLHKEPGQRVLTASTPTSP